MSGTVQKYTKKPVEIEAIQFTKDNVEAVLEFLKTGSERGKQVFGFNQNTLELQINTLEGVMKADIGDYIIKGLKREFYPCKPDIFEMSYNLATTFTDRLENEYESLADKIGKLSQFRHSDKFDELNYEMRFLLTTQEFIMHSYLSLLQRRIYILNETNK